MPSFLNTNTRSTQCCFEMTLSPSHGLSVALGAEEKFSITAEIRTTNALFASVQSGQYTDCPVPAPSSEHLSVAALDKR